MTQSFQITAARASNLDDAEVRRRICRAYRIILDYAPTIDTADRGEFGDLTRPAAGDEPTLPSSDLSDHNSPNGSATGG
jgi:hypothetical protein